MLTIYPAGYMENVLMRRTGEVFESLPRCWRVSLRVAATQLGPRALGFGLPAHVEQTPWLLVLLLAFLFLPAGAVAEANRAQQSEVRGDVVGREPGRTNEKASDPKVRRLLLAAASLRR